MPVNLLDLSRSELEAFVVEDLKEPRFRVAQLWQWLWQKGAQDFAAMTNVSKALRAKLASLAEVRWPEVDRVQQSRDGTVKLLLKLADGALVETVLIPAEGRFTQCLSTQVGCAMACTFCNTGRMGFARNLTQAEILGQILVGRHYLAERNLSPLKNLVFMGMGEPLLNLDNLLKSLETLNSGEGLGFSSRKTTVSTVGLPRELTRLAESGLALPAISLHAPTQELREKLMPKAAAIAPLPELMACLDQLPLRPRERITYEYLLIRGVNDSLKEAQGLVKLLGGRRSKVNLIAYNPSPGIPYAAPEPETVLAFEKHLWDKHITATLRKSMGQDIAAACGQLRAERMATGG